MTAHLRVCGLVKGYGLGNGQRTRGGCLRITGYGVREEGPHRSVRTLFAYGPYEAACSAPGIQETVPGVSSAFSLRQTNTQVSRLAPSTPHARRNATNRS